MPERWVLYALAGAFFAAVSNVLSKPALDGLEVSVANTVRAAVMLLVLAVATTASGHWATLPGAPRSALLLIVLAGVAAAASWFCGYEALKLASVHNSYPVDKLSVVFAVLLAVIFLGERPSLTNLGGIGLMLVGGWLVTRQA